MSWAGLALLSAGFFGLVSVLDKFIIGRHVSDVRTFNLMIGILAMATGVVILMANPLVPNVSSQAVGFAVATGLSSSVAAMLLFLVLRNEEVSRAVPVAQTFPIFVAILATVFFHEVLGFWKWLAIVVTLSGAVAISVRVTPGGGFLQRRSFFLLILSSFAGAVGHTLSKQALQEISLLNMIGVFFVCLALGLFIVSLRRRFLWEIYAIMKQPLKFSWFVADMVIAAVALWLQFSAYAVGPVSLASTLVATRPMFVFFYAILLSWIAPRFIQEPVNSRVIVVKLFAIAMIVGGSSRIIMG